MQIIPISNIKALSLACATLSRGELVIFPTETCYGLAVDATNPAAITKLLAYKGDRHRQVAIAVANQAMAQQYVSLNDIATNLYTHFLPGPLTVISQSKKVIDSRLESATSTLGVRIPNYPFTQLLIQKFGRPLTATSGNTSGKKEPYSLQDWQKYTTPAKQKLVSLFLDAGKLADRPTSTVVDTTLNDPAILRQGEIFLPNSSPSFTTHSSAETQQFASTLTKQYLNLTNKYPLIFALQGELGTGKTQFSKGIAGALSITTNVNSPTYTLLHEYPYGSQQGVSLRQQGDSLQSKYSGIFYHLDTWRLPDPTELESTLHLSTLLKPGNVFAIEWAGKAKKLLNQYQNSCVIIYLDIKEISDQERLITYAFTTPEWN
ncbi:MAG: L-threonylcarbamoyladenylate synthase [bacterium]